MRPTKYVYVFGSGVQDPWFYKYFNQALIDRFKSLNCRLIGVRGNISKRFLNDWGIQCKVIGDPCLSLKPTQMHQRSSNRVAINIGDAKAQYSSKSRSKVVKEMTEVCNVLKSTGYELIIVPFWKDNLDDIQDLSEGAQIQVFSNWQDVEATMNLLSSCEILIGEKLHSIVLSAAANTPFIGLAYSPEHFDFVESVGFSAFTLPITKITAEEILTLFDDLINRYGAIQNKLSSLVSEYREKQSKFADEIACDIDSLPEDKWFIQNDCKNTLLLRIDKQIYTKTGRAWNIWNRAVFSQLMPHLI
jgi:polysaccharide pyruvyl transferase WcaK-like protein